VTQQAEACSDTLQSQLKMTTLIGGRAMEMVVAILPIDPCPLIDGVRGMLIRVRLVFASTPFSMRSLTICFCVVQATVLVLV
jgi:hypothetical protein